MLCILQIICNNVVNLLEIELALQYNNLNSHNHYIYIVSVLWIMGIKSSILV
ncbi:hypothetical protein Desgi_1064 [Desulfoscipio gibsoniae DSM 7213]|uniref:Uncharacterized protein n=1 Tax=Desulfoscipio gibsoniae DSM 7213 TaxID=767817 RepID=R4KBP1_9FIRM|nr:hypothetical protein Desgi_1064 [Desulfoscipio gibsoniae DSM 7213]